MKTASIALLFIMLIALKFTTFNSTKISNQPNVTFDIGGNTSTPPDKSKS